MKKLYSKKKGGSAVHPTPSVVAEHLLSFLPAAILALTAALSPAEREVLAYLISCSSKTHHRGTAARNGSCGDHEPSFSCSCFRCYMSYWVKWDASPNRQLIHEVIDAFEESLVKEKGKGGRKERRKGRTVRGNNNVGHNGLLDDAETKMGGSAAAVVALTEEEFRFDEPSAAAENSGESGGGGGEEEVGSTVEEEENEKGSVRRFVSFLGERIWSVWG